jgi:hypothetical protein
MNNVKTIVRLMNKPELTYGEVNRLSHLTYTALPAIISNLRRGGQRELANSLSRIEGRVTRRFERMSGPPVRNYNSNNNEGPVNYKNNISRERGRNANYNNFMTALKRNMARHGPVGKYAKHWREMMPYEVRQGRVNVKLPANTSDIVSYKNFNRGNEAIMVVKKRIVNGRVRPKRYYIEKSTFARLAGMPWTQAMRKSGATAMFRDPLNRRQVYRRNLMNVKFV